MEPVDGKPQMTSLQTRDFLLVSAHCWQSRGETNIAIEPTAIFPVSVTAEAAATADEVMAGAASTADEGVTL